MIVYQYAGFDYNIHTEGGVFKIEPRKGQHKNARKEKHIKAALECFFKDFEKQILAMKQEKKPYKLPERFHVFCFKKRTALYSTYHSLEEATNAFEGWCVDDNVFFATIYRGNFELVNHIYKPTILIGKR
jgi:hypothetical protein